MIRENAESFIIPLLVAMLYISFLQIPLEELKKAFKNKRFTLTSITINFIWTPFIAWLFALMFLGDHPALYIGFIMLLVTPCTDWYLIFTGIAKGNVALSAAILPLNLILQVILLPFYLLIFGETTGDIQLNFLVEGILFVLIIPLTLAVLTKRLLRSQPHVKKNIIVRLNIFPMVLLGIAIVAMFASQGKIFLDHLDLMWKISIPFLLFFFVNFFIGQTVGKWMRFPKPDIVSLSLTTLARNSPIALAIAMTAFPEQPLISLTLVIGPLLELPILATITQVLIGISKKK